MSNYILSQPCNTLLKSHPGAYDIELERTPGAVAVSGIYEVGGEAPTLPPSPLSASVSPKQTQSPSYPCGSLAIFTECESEKHHFAKKILCGKEWCPTCGEDNSQAHNRRIARLLYVRKGKGKTAVTIPRITQISKLGYFVIEFPDRYRRIPGYVGSRKGLEMASRIILDTLAGKRMGRRGRVGGYFKRGVLRWHFFGDKVPGKWNPHANVLVDGAFIDGEQLASIKKALQTALKCPELIVHYGYFEQPGEIYHKVRYITRATFHKYEWWPSMARQLFNFRNCRWWGSWKDAPAWTLTPEIEAEAEAMMAVGELGSGICPECGAKLKKWSKPVDSIYLTIWGAVEYGKSGYYRIPQEAWNQGELSPGARLRLEQLEAEAKDKPSVDILMVDARLRAKRWLSRCSTIGGGGS